MPQSNPMLHDALKHQYQQRTHNRNRPDPSELHHRMQHYSSQAICSCLQSRKYCGVCKKQWRCHVRRPSTCAKLTSPHRHCYSLCFTCGTLSCPILCHSSCNAVPFSWHEYHSKYRSPDDGADCFAHMHCVLKALLGAVANALLRNTINFARSTAQHIFATFWQPMHEQEYLFLY